MWISVFWCANLDLVCFDVKKSGISVFFGVSWKWCRCQQNYKKLQISRMGENCDVISEVQMFRWDFDQAEREGGKRVKSCRQRRKDSSPSNFSTSPDGSFKCKSFLPFSSRHHWLLGTRTCLCAKIGRDGYQEVKKLVVALCRNICPRHHIQHFVLHFASVT